MKEKVEIKEEKISIIDVILLIVFILILIFIFSIYIICNQTNDYVESVIPEDYGKPTERRTFNSNFTPYEGANQSAGNVRSLVSDVHASNANNEEHQVELIMPEKLSGSKVYKVELEYGEDEYINRIVVTEIKNRETFNRQYEQYIGKGLSASKIRKLISLIKESNSENEEHQVKLIGPEEIDDKTTYKTEVEYGSNKYINRIDIIEE